MLQEPEQNNPAQMEEDPHLWHYLVAILSIPANWTECSCIYLLELLEDITDHLLFEHEVIRAILRDSMHSKLEQLYIVSVGDYCEALIDCEIIKYRFLKSKNNLPTAGTSAQVNKNANAKIDVYKFDE